MLYHFQLRLANGEPADPPKAELAAAVWGHGSEITGTCWIERSAPRKNGATPAVRVRAVPETPAPAPDRVRR